MKRAFVARTVMLFAAVAMMSVAPHLASAKKKPPTEPPAAVLDQQQANSNSNATILMTEEAAQTFVPGGDGELAHVNVMLDFTPGNSSAPSNGLTVEIQEAIWGLAIVDGFGGPTIETWIPSGVVLASAFLPKEDFYPGEVRWYTFAFPAPAAVSGGATYAVVLSDGAGIPQAGQEPDKYFWGLMTSAVVDPYVDGEMLYSSGAWNFVWSASSVLKDFAFETYMIFTEPEPTAEICDDGIDNDGDNKIDCADRKDCRTDPFCQ